MLLKPRRDLKIWRRVLTFCGLSVKACTQEQLQFGSRLRPRCARSTTQAAANILFTIPVTVYEQGMPHRSSVLRRTCTCRHKCPQLFLLPPSLYAHLPVSGQQRLHIITLHCNRPDFMLLQRKSFHHFLRDLNVDWTIVFDNPDSSVENALRAQCESISFTFGHTTCLQLPVDAKTGAAPGDASGTHSQIFSWLWREVAMKRLRGQLL